MYVGSFGTLAHPVRAFNPLIARNLAGSRHQSRVVEKYYSLMSLVWFQDQRRIDKRRIGQT